MLSFGVANVAGEVLFLEGARVWTLSSCWMYVDVVESLPKSILSSTNSSDSIVMHVYASL